MHRERRRFAVGRLLAFALVLASGHVLPGMAATEQAAATARPGLRSLGAPPPLGTRDIQLYEQILTLQERADWADADRLIAQLDDQVLLGHVLYQRYMHPTGYRSRFEELSAWLEQYADHPDADRVYRLALRRRPPGAPQPQGPVRGYLAGAGQELQERGTISYRSALERTPSQQALVESWRDAIADLVAAGRASDAEGELERADVAPLLDPVELDLARWSVARGHLASGNHDKALTLAARAVAGSGSTVPEIRWTAGLSAWRLGRMHLAAWHFAKLAQAESAIPAERARAAFWAARSYLVQMRPQLVSRYLRLAATGRDFYGLLARSILGRPLADGADEIAFEDGALQELLRYPGVRRAIALGQLGQVAQAEREIRKLAARAAPELMAGLVALAKSLDLPAAQMRLAQSLGRSDGRYDLSALFPVPNWRPANGYTLDRALVFAFMRAESGFDPSAESHAGARGLMQVMPATARYIAARADLDHPQGNALFEPETSILFGQAYLEHLLQRPSIGDNLIYLAVAYNAGPGRVLQWRETLGIEDDPLLFLESIPLREPRVYVKKVLTNLWTYRARFGQAQSALKALAKGRWPAYRALDRDSQIHAWN
ncbi:MAG: lytic transglycosylase domain-containing protein [Geminicoccaceae bacterium]